MSAVLKGNQLFARIYNKLSCREDAFTFKEAFRIDNGYLNCDAGLNVASTERFGNRNYVFVYNIISTYYLQLVVRPQLIVGVVSA